MHFRVLPLKRLSFLVEPGEVNAARLHAKANRQIGDGGFP